MEQRTKSPNETVELQRRVDGLEKELEKVKNVIYAAKEILTLEEAAAFMGVTKSTLYKMTHLQTIPYFKPNNKMVYFEKSELVNWVKQNHVASKAQIDQEANLCMQRLALKQR